MPEPSSPLVWMNGAYHDDPRQMSVADKITLGMSVFTTLLASRDGAGAITLHFWDDHYARLCRHAAMLDVAVPYAAQDLAMVAERIVRHTRESFCAVRVQVSAGEGGRGLVYPATPTVFMTAASVPDPATVTPVRVMIARDISLYSQDIMTRIKSNYAVRALARRRAGQLGFDDVVFLNEKGHITSASVGNIVVRCGADFFTPPLVDGVLDGIRRGEGLKSGKWQEKSLTEADFLCCDAAWVVNSLGIKPIICIDTVQKPVTSMG